MPFGEDFILEDIPIGTRVIYPNPPIKGLPNREAAIRYAVNHPLEMEPLYASARAGNAGDDRDGRHFAAAAADGDAGHAADDA